MIYEQIRALGRNFDNAVLDSTRALFEKLERVCAPDVQKQSRSYGQNERHQVDIYWTEGENKPVLILVPGGGFIRGDRINYEHFGRYYAAQGFVVLITDYRLAPQWQWPAGAEDVAALISWAVRRVEEYGGAGDSLFVFGHSAGATHVAGALLDPRQRTNAHGHVLGWILMSGNYQIRPDDARPNILAYFGNETGLFAERSPINHVSSESASVLLMFAQYDPVGFASSAFELGLKLTGAHDRPPAIHSVAGHNHISPLLAAGTRYHAIEDPIRSFVDQCRSPGT